MGNEWISGFVVLLSHSVVLFHFFCFNATVVLLRALSFLGGWVAI